MNVLITSRSFLREVPEAQALLREAGLTLVERIRDLPWSEDDLIGMVGEADAAVAGLDPYTARVFAATSRLKVVARNGVGVDSVDVEAAGARGVYVTNAGPAVADSVADLTLGLLLSLVRSIPQAVVETRAGSWKRRVGRDLAGQALGLIGTGNIGRAVAKRATACGMRILAYDVRLDAAWAAACGAEYVPLDRLLAEADIVTLHLPLMPSTRGMIGKRELALMRPGAFLVNTSRGGMVDEGALYSALREGKLAGAALDVFEVEPPGDNPLLSLPNVLVTPHIGSATREATAAACLIAARNVVEVLAGRPPLSAVNASAVQRALAGRE
ncbi:MAG: phosphoglycerate dehydrogenase [Anaerolineae bacterium]